MNRFVAIERAANEGRNVLPDATDDQAAVIEQWAAEAIKVTVRLNDLTPDQRRLVLALIEANKQAT